QPEMLTQTAADQFPHHPGGPQGKGQLELFGAFVRDPGPHAPCLGLGQPAFAPAMGVQATVKQRLFTVTGVVAQPLIDGLTPDANRLRGFSLGLVQAQDQENRTDPKGRLRGAAEATKVFLFHAAKYNGFNSKCQVLCWEISMRLGTPTRIWRRKSLIFSISPRNVPGWLTRACAACGSLWRGTTRFQFFLAA